MSSDECTWQAYEVGATCQPTSDRSGDTGRSFGGAVPSGEVADDHDSLCAISGIEHFTDGALAHLLVLSSAVGVMDVDAADLSVADNRGTQYSHIALATTHGLGHVLRSLWISPAVPTDATELTVVCTSLTRVAPNRQGGPIERPLPGGPWTVTVPLYPPRTVTDVPDEPERRRRMPPAPSATSRTYASFQRLVPIGQARVHDGIAICALSAEVYSDRWVLSVAVFGESETDGTAPLTEATVTAWDNRSGRYRSRPMHGTTHERGREAAFEMVPRLDPDASAIAVRISDFGGGSAADTTFGIRISQS